MTKYIECERARYLPVSRELMAQYRDGSHTKKYDDGRLAWYQNNQYHRDSDKPAVICANGDAYWYQNNQLHRDNDKPAIIWADGTLEWFQNDKLHRFRGPAVIYSDKLEWVIYDENITQEVNEWLAGEEWQGTPEQVFEFKLRFS